jgi:hypothetical protein
MTQEAHAPRSDSETRKTMNKAKKPAVVLELAPLPREQVGPFLLLGVDKLADKEQIEANWAQRVIWARKSQSKVPLEDVNWAREHLNDPEKRIRADAASLNADTTTGVLRRLKQCYDGKTVSAPGCAPLDVEKPLAAYTPPTEIPDVAELRSAIVIPDIPQEFPAIQKLLDEYLAQPLDPWKLDIGRDPHER